MSEPILSQNIGLDLCVKTNPYEGPTFTLANRISRLVWSIVWQGLFRLSPTPLHSWRNFLLRAFGASIGRSCHVYPSVRIWAPWRLEMEDFSSLGPDVYCYNIATVRLGARVVVSQGVRLCTGSHDYQSPSFQLTAQPIQINDDSWVCAEAFLLPGVTIDNGCIVGARAVVTKPQPAWSICAGNPCKPIKARSKNK